MHRKVIGGSIGAAAMALCLVSGSALASDDAQLISIEKSLWAGWATHDAGPFDKHMTDDNVNLAGGMLMVGKAAVMKDIASGSCKVASYDLGEVKVTHPADNVAILVYTATQDGTCGKHTLDKKIHATAVYVKKDGSWKEALYAEAPAKN